MRRAKVVGTVTIGGCGIIAVYASSSEGRAAITERSCKHRLHSAQKRLTAALRTAEGAEGNDAAHKPAATKQLSVLASKPWLHNDLRDLRVAATSNRASAPLLLELTGAGPLLEQLERCLFNHAAAGSSMTWGERIVLAAAQRVSALAAVPENDAETRLAVSQTLQQMKDDTAGQPCAFAIDCKYTATVSDAAAFTKELQWSKSLADRGLLQLLTASTSGTVHAMALISAALSQPVTDTADTDTAEVSSAADDAAAETVLVIRTGDLSQPQCQSAVRAVFATAGLTVTDSTVVLVASVTRGRHDLILQVSQLAQALQNSMAIAGNSAASDAPTAVADAVLDAVAAVHSDAAAIVDDASGAIIDDDAAAQVIVDTAVLIDLQAGAEFDDSTTPLAATVAAAVATVEHSDDSAIAADDSASASADAAVTTALQSMLTDTRTALLHSMHMLPAGTAATAQQQHSTYNVPVRSDVLWSVLQYVASAVTTDTHTLPAHTVEPAALVEACHITVEELVQLIDAGLLEVAPHPRHVLDEQSFTLPCGTAAAAAAAAVDSQHCYSCSVPLQVTALPLSAVHSLEHCTVTCPPLAVAAFSSMQALPEGAFLQSLHTIHTLRESDLPQLDTDRMRLRKYWAILARNRQELVRSRPL
eukprot:11407-Heterococcus_DN1.PRE.1